MSYKIQKITEPLLLGEAPHWDEPQQALFFVGIPEKTINKYVLASGYHTKTTLDGPPGFIIPVEGTIDQFIVGVEHKFLIIQWDGQEGSQTKVVRELGEIDLDKPGNKINDAKADPRGRLFGGTMLQGSSVPKGSLYRIDTAKGCKIDRVVEDISVSNGLAWDLKEKAFYYIDSEEAKVRRYDYDVETGNISNKTYIFDLRKNNLDGHLDGATIDTDGNLWIAVFGGSCILKVDPRTEKLLDKIPIPAKQVTSLTFGGLNYDILFVTTAKLDYEGVQPPPCGATFMVTGLGVKGLPNVSFKF